MSNEKKSADPPVLADDNDITRVMTEAELTELHMLVAMDALRGVARALRPLPRLIKARQAVGSNPEG